MGELCIRKKKKEYIVLILIEKSVVIMITLVDVNICNILDFVGIVLIQENIEVRIC